MTPEQSSPLGAGGSTPGEGEARTSMTADERRLLNMTQFSMSNFSDAYFQREHLADSDVDPIIQKFIFFVTIYFATHFRDVVGARDAAVTKAPQSQLL